MSKVAGAVIGTVLVVAGTFIPGAQAIVPYGYSLIIGNALSLISQALVSKPRSRKLGQDIEYSGTVEPRRIIFGQMRVSGMNAIPPWTSGTNNQHLHQVLVIAGHEVEEIGDVYFGETVIPGNSSPLSIAPITGTLGDGEILSGDYAGKAWVRRYVGTDSQTADYILDTAFVDWTSNHRGRGIAYAAMKYELDEAVFKTGKPEVSFLVRGAKCYDPRLDSSPGNDPTNASYIAYTSNPALCLGRYLLDPDIGLGESADRIDWDLVVAAANICDEDVAIPPSASPLTTQSRYTCNAVLYVAASEDERRENIKILVESMMGHVIYRGGQWRMYAGAATSSSFALTEDDLAGKFELRTETPANEKYNYVRGQFVDAARNYQLSEFEPRSSSAFETEDGDQYPREVVFQACTNQYEAQRNAIIVLNRSRRKRQLTAILGMSAYRIRPWDVGTITLEEMGWDEQLVRCISWSFNANGTIEAAFLEEDPDDWDDPLVSDYTVPSVGVGPGPAEYIPDPPDSFSITPVVDGLILSWERATTNPIQTLFNIYEADESSPVPMFSSSPTVVTKIVSKYNGNGMFLPRTTADTKYYWITSEDLVSRVESDPLPAGVGVEGTPLSITSGFRLSVDRGSHHKFLVGTGSGTTDNTSTVTPIGGTNPVTHSWVRVSGSTKISATASSSATTGFSATGLADQEAVSAVFEDTGTDSSSPQQTATIQVSAAFTRDDSFGS